MSEIRSIGTSQSKVQRAKVEFYFEIPIFCARRAIDPASNHSHIEHVTHHHHRHPRHHDHNNNNNGSQILIEVIILN